MTLSTQPADTDLLVPLPGPDEPVHPYTVHTHYFGFTIPEAGIGTYLYARYMPAFRLSQGGPVIFRGMDNVSLLDAEYHDYRATMPWPEVTGDAIRFDNGYEIHFVRPGELVHLRYKSPDGEVGFDLEQRAVTPLVARGHIVPGEEDHHNDPARHHGGSEQFMHCTGELSLRGEIYPVDCYAVRDRSWNQVRTEEPGGAQPCPPVGWTPAYFGDDLSFNVARHRAGLARALRRARRRADVLLQVVRPGRGIGRHHGRAPQCPRVPPGPAQRRPPGAGAG